MARQLGLLLLCLTAVLVLAGQLAHAAGPHATPEDLGPFWSDDARLVAFTEERGAADGTRATPAAAGPERAFGAGRPRGFRPGGGDLLEERDGRTLLLTADGRLAGVFDGVDAAWSPDGGRIAFLRGGTLYVSAADDAAAATPVATGVVPPSWDATGPAWSPDGTRIAVASGSSLLLVRADGSGVRTLFTGANQSVNPSWAPAGTLVAFERNEGPHWSIWVVGADGSDPRQAIGGASNDRYPQWSPVSDRLAFISDRQHIPGGATQYRYALYVTTLEGGRAAKLVDDVHPYSPPRWSPTAAQLAVAAGQECGRWGIYVVRSDGFPSTAHRRSNPCRFDGTPAGERLVGTPWHDLIRGFGGDDRIAAGAGPDRIEGDDGNDTILAGAGNDVVLGGPGDDRIFGGPGNDVIVGGNGRDRIDCGPGDDTVEAAGPLDRIAASCEHVRR